MELSLPMNYTVLDQDEMMYLDGGALSSSDRAWLIGAAFAATVVIGVALWYGAWHLAARMMGFTVKTVARKAGAAAVVGALATFVGISVGLAWKIVDKCL